MARVHPLKETTKPHESGEWALWFQWCLYDLDDGPQYGYRFIWKRKDGSLQAARGQARLPSIDEATDLMTNAKHAGWGDRDGDLIAEAGDRLEKSGCVVNLRSGYVGWPDKSTALSAHLSQSLIEDAQLIESWCS